MRTAVAVIDESQHMPCHIPCEPYSWSRSPSNLNQQLIMIGKNFTRFRGIVVFGIVPRDDFFIHEFAMMNRSRRDWWWELERFGTEEGYALQRTAYGLHFEEEEKKHIAVKFRASSEELSRAITNSTRIKRINKELLTLRWCQKRIYSRDGQKNGCNIR